MNEFKTYHPIVNFTYFAFVIVLSCLLMSPPALCISLVSGFIYSVMLNGKKQILKNILYMFPALIGMTLINPAFNHSGVTILGYLPGGNPLTLESVIYGFCAAMMLLGVVCHFSCYNEVMTSDKFMYLFGRIIPSMSLVISMTLRFVPRFIAHLKVVKNAQMCMGRNISGGSIINRAKSGMRILSVMITWSLENAVETADSMKSRGYGLQGRTAFSIFRFDKRDKKALFRILFLGIYTLAGNFYGAMYFRYFPSIVWGDISPYTLSVFASYLFLCLSPVIIEIREVIRWKVYASKI